MKASRKYRIILNGKGIIAFLVACLGLIAVLVRFGGLLGGWFATHSDLIQAAAALLGVTGLIAGILGWYLRIKRRVGDFPFDVVDPYKHEAVLPTIFRVKDLNDPLSAYHVPYQTGREGDEDIQSKMRKLLQSKQRLIIKGPTGVGKTREGGELATTLCKEGWAVIVLRKLNETIWLGRPEKWPPIDEKRIIVFLDDMHTLCNPAIQPESPLTEVPFAPNPSFQDRLKTFLRDLEERVGDKVLVIATSRSEPEQWRKLDPNNPFWDSFAQYEIRRFTDEAGGRLLDNYTKQLNVPLSGSPTELAHKSDGMADTLVRNVQVASQKGQSLDASTLTKTAKGNYEEIYRRFIENYPDEAKTIANLYDATYIIRELGLPLHEELVLNVALELFKSPKATSFLYRPLAKKALKRLISEPRWWEEQNKILIVREGLLEGKAELPNPYDYLDGTLRVVQWKSREIANILDATYLSYLERAKKLVSTMGSSATKLLFPVYQQLYNVRPELISISRSRRIVLAQYLLTDDAIFILGIRADWDEPAIVKIKQPLSEIRNYVKANFGLEKGMKGGPTGRKVRALDVKDWQERFSPLITPFQEWANPGDYLCIVPDNVLHYLPLHTLKLDGEYLIERNPVLYLPTASILKYCQAKRKGRREKALVFGDADTQFPLPGAREEAIQVAQLFESQLYLGSEARKSVLKEKLKEGHDEIDILHFACFGYPNPDFPDKSGILMAPDVKNLDEIYDESAHSILTAEEIFHLEMATDLVTLSGDVTSYNELRPGDELMGLVRAFIYAGTPSVIATLWGVDDLSTQFLMIQFYERLKAGDTKVEALQKAQLYVKDLSAADIRAYYEDKLSKSATIDDDSQQKRIGEGIRSIHTKLLEAEEIEGHPVKMDYPIFSHPFYWAPFILIGDWE